MRGCLDIRVDSEAINRKVHEAMDEAMQEIDKSLQHLEDLPFGYGRRGRRERHAEWRREHRERRQRRERTDMYDTLKALERGEIDVDEAMARLDE
jgi:hypothetical protein